jgi:hypothetical protein
MTQEPALHRGDDRLLFGIILGVVAFWLFAQTTLNIAPAMAVDLGVATNVMNIAVSITALFSGIFIVVGLARELACYVYGYRDLTDVRCNATSTSKLPSLRSMW